MSHTGHGSADNKVRILLVLLHRAGIKVQVTALRKVLDFLEKYSERADVCEAKNILNSSIENFTVSATTEESTSKVVQSWNQVIKLYESSEDCPEPVVEEGQSEQPTERKFPWAWITTVVFMTALGFTMGSMVFPNVKVANTKATAELEKKLVDQANQFSRDRNAFDAACLNKQMDVAKKTADACSQAWNDRLSGKK
jgi:hypothetical protein